MPASGVSFILEEGFHEYPVVVAGYDGEVGAVVDPAFPVAFWVVFAGLLEQSLHVPGESGSCVDGQPGECVWASCEECGHGLNGVFLGPFPGGLGEGFYLFVFDWSGEGSWEPVVESAGEYPAEVRVGLLVWWLPC